MISQSQALSWKNFWSLTFPSYNTKYSNHIRSIMINSALIPHGVLLWWQRKTWKSVAHPSDLFFSNNNGFQVLMCHHAVRKDTHAGLQRILRHAMNYGCGSAIRCNEWQLLIRHRAVRKDTHAGLQRILRHAMNQGCGSAIVCNELRLLIRHRAVRKDTHAGLQRMPSAGWPSCDQKRHTRWHVTNSGWWCDHTRWHATNSGWWCDFVPSETRQRILGLKDFRVKKK